MTGCWSIRNGMFQSLSGNSSVVGGPKGVRITPKTGKFQSLSGNSSVVGLNRAEVVGKGLDDVSIPFREFKCCRGCLPPSKRKILSAVSIPFREFKCCRGPLSLPANGNQISFNPFQGIQVLSGGVRADTGRNIRDRFNPFQGIQVLSGMICPFIIPSAGLVSIPFREFKCCRTGFPCSRWRANMSFNPFQGIQVLSGFPVCGNNGGRFKFQSLSGNSSVVGLSTMCIGADHPAVSIPFREFKCCREMLAGAGMVSVPGRFNPFQGIQVLSGMIL